MAYAKIDMKQAFGRRKGYQTDIPNPEVEGETIPNTQPLNEFIAEKQLEWAKSEAIQQIRREERQKVDLQVSADTDGVDLI